MERKPIDLFDRVAGTPQQVQEAIVTGADVNRRDQNGMTPLMWASTANTNPEVVSLLLAAGADLEAQDNYGFTSLMLAVEFNQNPAVIVALLESGADVKAKDKGGRTALYYAQKRPFLHGTLAFQELKNKSTSS